jgi:hypothetical protein
VRAVEGEHSVAPVRALILLLLVRQTPV